MASSHVSAPSTNNSNRPAMTMRVQRLLQSSSYKNSETLSALETLASFDLLDPVQATSHSNNVDEGQSNQQPYAESSKAGAAAALSGTSAGSQLRRSVERRLGSGARDFLGAFASVNAELTQLQSHLDEMHACCAEVGDRLKSANAGSKPLLEHAESLRKQRADTAVKQQVISAFLDRFTLSPAEIQVIESPSTSVSPQLFTVMAKIIKIREHCQLLLAASDTSEADQGDVSTKAGMDIMRTTSAQLDQAYNKLHKFASFQVRGYTRPEVEVSPLMRDVMQQLRPRQDLFQSVLDLLATNRSAALLSQFIEALTRGGPSGLPRPIELHAHDPIRYVGDMLAWIHQLMAGEREFLESLFYVKADQRRPGAVRSNILHQRTQSTTDQHVADEVNIRRLMDKDLEGCGRPLKLRILQTVKSQEGSLMAYRISNLVLFYKQTIERTVGVEALMSSVLADIASQATDAFYEILESNSRSLLRFIQPPPSDLTPPPMLREAMTNLKEIMEVYQAALLDQVTDPQSQPSDPKAGFEPVFERALDPALQMSDQMAELQASSWDRTVFQLNCQAYVKAVLDVHESFASVRAQQVQKTLDQKGEELVRGHYTSLLKESGLAPLKETLDTRKDDEPLARIPSASAPALSAALRTFDEFLTSSVLATSPKLGLITSPRLASQIHQSALARLSETYGELFDTVMSGKEGYEFGVTRMRRTKEEVQTLLGVA